MSRRTEKLNPLRRVDPGWGVLTLSVTLCAVSILISNKLISLFLFLSVISAGGLFNRHYDLLVRPNNTNINSHFMHRLAK